MIGAIKNVLTSSQLASVAQNTTQSVAAETVLKSIGRPGFILIKKILILTQNNMQRQKNSYTKQLA